jgi:hypothetical protein
MQYLYSARQCGKTTRMLLWLMEKPERMLVVINHQEEMRLRSFVEKEYPKQNMELGLQNRILGWSDYKNRSSRWVKVKEISIDNADMILQSMVNNPIANITFTGTDKTVEKLSPPNQ